MATLMATAEGSLTLNTTCGTMNRKRLNRVRRKIQSLRSRSANIRSRQLVALARGLGRRRFDRGKEPTYISACFSDARPITIPSHSGALKRFTAAGILDGLEDDILRWEESLSAQESEAEDP